MGWVSGAGLTEEIWGCGRISGKEYVGEQDQRMGRLECLIIEPPERIDTLATSVTTLNNRMSGWRTSAPAPRLTPRPVLDLGLCRRPLLSHKFINQTLSPRMDNLELLYTF